MRNFFLIFIFNYLVAKPSVRGASVGAVRQPDRAALPFRTVTEPTPNAITPITRYSSSSPPAYNPHIVGYKPIPQIKQQSTALNSVIYFY